jgi:hypothetical protein
LIESPPIFSVDNAETEDSAEALEFDEKDYPILPDNVLELRLHRRKAILRQYMGASRRSFYDHLFYFFGSLKIPQDTTSSQGGFRGLTLLKTHRTTSHNVHDPTQIISLKNRPT